MIYEFNRGSVSEALSTLTVKQLCTFSHDVNYNITINDKSQLRRYSFPHFIHLSNFSLSGSAIEQQLFAKDIPDDWFEKQYQLNLIRQLIAWEKHTLQKTDADFLGNEKVFKLILKSYNKNQQNFKINMIWLDAQIFMFLIEDDFKVVRDFDRNVQAKRTYEKLNFRTFMTQPLNSQLPKKAVLCSNYCSLTQTTLGTVKIFFAGNIDSVEGDSITETSVEEPKNTVGLCTYPKVQSINGRDIFAKRLKPAWVEAKLKGREKTVFAFTTQYGYISSVEEFKTSEIPRLYKEYVFDHKHNDQLYFENSFAHCEALLSWVKQTMSKDTSKAWRLNFQKANNKISLRELVGEDAVDACKFLSEEFIEWRENLRINAKVSSTTNN